MATLAHLPLHGIKVLELEGLAPSVFTGMVLADFGAEVTLINRLTSTSPVAHSQEELYVNRGKKSIALDLKNAQDLSILKQMLTKADVLVDAYRPGVLESLGLGFQQLQELNARLILVRVTGYGQTGPMRKTAGHDLNYLAMSGVLSTFGREGEVPSFPGNILADFGGGGAFGVLGVLLALLDRQRTQRGQEVDVAINEAVGYLGIFLHNMQRSGLWDTTKRGSNLLDGGAPFYRCYECADGKFVAVGAIEPQFYQRFVQALGLAEQESQYCIDNQINREEWQKFHTLFEQIFKKRTRDQWVAHFAPLDCCVTPVLETNELQQNAHWLARGTFANAQYQPHPLLKATNSISKNKKSPARDENREEVLKSYGISSAKVAVQNAKL